jgi:hypothetical protein
MKPLSHHALWLVIAYVAFVVTIWKIEPRLRRLRAGNNILWAVQGVMVYAICCLFLMLLWPPSANSRWDASVLGRYHLYMITADSAAIYDSSVPGVFDGGVMQLPGHREIVFGVRTIQIHAPWIFGEATPSAFSNEPMPYDVPLLFSIDTRDGNRVDFPTYDALRTASGNLGAPLDLRPVAALFARSRHPQVNRELLLFALLPSGLLLFFIAIRSRSRPLFLPVTPSPY